METIELSNNSRSIPSNEISQPELMSERSRTGQGTKKKILMIFALTLSLMIVLFIGVSLIFKIYPTPWNNAFSLGMCVT